jgi:hypothetical protein
MGYRLIECPECSKEIQVPEELESVICTYCGAKFNIADYAYDGGMDEACAACYDNAVSILDNRLTLAQDASKVFNLQMYEPAFIRYYNILTGSLDYFDRAYRDYKGDKDKLVADYASEFGRRILENMGQAQKDKNAVMEDYVYLYIIFAVPAVMKYEKTYSDKMSDILLDTWNQRYPKRKLSKAGFEKINAGFKKKWCFITTAVTKTLGLPDDCYELNSFRKFRDEYLAEQPLGRLEIMEYYMTAPSVVEAIDKSPSREQIYRDIWNRHLNQCLRLYEQNHFEQCRQSYEDMMSELREKWM